MRREKEVGEYSTELGRKRQERGEERLIGPPCYHPTTWVLLGGTVKKALGETEREKLVGE